jgi:exonuclease SbcC
MKPLILTVQAFGPFSGTQSVNFNELGSNPLFLINGATGAGKSSILDAICFALYGHTTGAERSASQMRCDFADIKLLTEVTLDFSLADKRYRITRIPMQERAKSVGEGTTPQNSKATLWELDGTDNNRLIVSSSVKDADHEIKSLIGLDVEQFRQVMVLPQGKFRELLLADSKDREKIFSQLFQTSIYKKIEDALKIKASEIRKAVEQHQNKIKGILEGAEVNTEEEVETGIELIKPKLESAQQDKTISDGLVNKSEKTMEAAKQLLKKFEDFAQKNKELDEHKLSTESVEDKKQQLKHALVAQKLTPLFNVKKESSKRLVDAKQKLALSSTELTEADSKLKSSIDAFDKAFKAQQTVESLQKKLAEFELYLKLANDLAEATAIATAINIQASDSKQKLEAKQASIEIIKAGISTQEKQAEQMSSEIGTLAEDQILLEKSKQLVKKRSNLETLNGDFAALKHQTARAKIVLDTSENELLKKLQSAKKVEFSWHSNQAAILAMELSEGEPCPVCGSLEHPSVASYGEDKAVKTKEDVDDARELVVQITKKRDQAKSTHDEALGQEKVKETLIAELTKELGEIATKSVKEIKAAHEVQDSKVNNILSVKEILKTNNESLTLDREQLTITIGSISALEKQASSDNEKLIVSRTNVEQFEGKIPEGNRDVDKLDLEIIALSANIKLLNNTLISTRKSKETDQSVFDKTGANNTALVLQLNEIEQGNVTAITNWEQAIAGSTFDDESHFTASLLNENEQALINSQVEEFKTKLDTLIGAKSQFEVELKNESRPVLEVIEEELKAAKLVFKDNDDKWRGLEERKNQLISVQRKLVEAHTKNEKLEKQYRTVGTLYEVSNGLTGDKISLQRFVLSVLLDDVLIQASQRLLLMSKGRYQLIRKEERAKGNKASGLELEVDDTYTGKSRPVATLSGGESFMAALSLALGLSDVVQSYSGGIKLDTLFIDEGFGSLDPESLDLAVRTLIDLQSSGRMIGIISHVTELKSQMGLRIDVKAGRDGSEISVVAA